MAGRGQENKEKIWIDYLGSKVDFFSREFVLRKVDKR